MEEDSLPQSFSHNLAHHIGPTRTKDKKKRTIEGSEKKTNSTLKTELGPPPVPPLGVVTDLVVSPETDPLGNGAVLVGLLGQLLLGAESLLGRHRRRCWRGRRKEKKEKRNGGRSFLVVFCVGGGDFVFGGTHGKKRSVKR